MQYRREIDGLRAVAVLPVILFHAGFETFRGGFVGVDVFFVISGYLITSLLLGDLKRGEFSIWRFYERRARRILPALFVVVACCIPPAFLWMMPSQMKDFSQSVVAVIAFASNILFWREEGYFAAASELKPLLHTWSLAVEEQYYLIFPPLLFLLWRTARGGTVWILAGLACMSLLFCEWGARNMPGFTFYLSPPRAWELFAGGLAAFAAVGRPQRSSDLASGLGLALVVVAVFAFDRTMPFPGILALVPVIGAALIILFAGPGTAVRHLLASRLFVGVGLISYSAYLWHQPLFAFARLRSLSEPPGWLMLVLAALSLALAAITWRFVEQPFRRGPLLATRRDVFAASGVGAAVLLAIGVAGHVSDGFRASYLVLHPGRGAELQLVEAAEVAAPFDPGTACAFHTGTLDDAALDRIRACAAEFGPGLLVLGDSHAIDLFGIVARQNPDGFVVGLSQAGCRPHTLGRNCPFGEVRALVADDPGLFRLVIYEQAGFYLLRSDRFAEGSRRMFAELPLDGGVPDYQINAGFVDRVTHYLDGIADHVPVVWFGPRVEPHIPLRVVLEDGCETPPPVRRNISGNFIRLDAYLNQHLLPTGVEFLSQAELFGYEFPRDFGSCAGLWWSDGDHLSAAGEAAMAARADVALAAAKVLGR